MYRQNTKPTLVDGDNTAIIADLTQGINDRDIVISALRKNNEVYLREYKYIHSWGFWKRLKFLFKLDRGTL